MSRRKKRLRAFAPKAEPAPPLATDLVIREIESEADLIALHLLMVMHGHEFSMVPINADKIMQKLISACEQPERHNMLLAVKDGHLVGYLCIEQLNHWYSDSDYLLDFGFYVIPAQRNGDVGPALMQEARIIAEQKNLALFIIISNPARRRGVGTRLQQRASLLRFVPSGAVLAFGKGE